MRKLLPALLLAGFTGFTAAARQTDTSFHHRYVQQVGLQINELVRQIFNFSGSTTAITNPYLLTYSINSVRTGWGLRLGAGYNYQSLLTDDGITRRETHLNDLEGRLGVDHLFYLSSKWTTGIGIDAVLNYNNDYTNSTVRSFDTTNTITKSKIISYGGGGMVWLRYHLTPKVLIGTEASFYYTTGHDKQDIYITQREFRGGGNQLVTSNSTVDNNQAEGKLSVPVAFYLIVKF